MPSTLTQWSPNSPPPPSSLQEGLRPLAHTLRSVLLLLRAPTLSLGSAEAKVERQV